MLLCVFMLYFIVFALFVWIKMDRDEFMPCCWQHCDLSLSTPAVEHSINLLPPLSLSHTHTHSCLY